jgi:hypothetical protein
VYDDSADVPVRASRHLQQINSFQGDKICSPSKLARIVQTANRLVCDMNINWSATGNLAIVAMSAATVVILAMFQTTHLTNVHPSSPS